MDFHYNCPHIAPSIGSPQYTGDPDLIFLREDLADEMGAIVGYLECADEIHDLKVSARFRETAGDEVGHFIQLTRMLATLDPVQAEELKKQGLAVLTVFSETGIPFGVSCNGCPEGNHDSKRHHPGDKRRYQPGLKDMECLRNAIRDELHAINAYQKQVQVTVNTGVKTLLTTIMNKEKEHVAEFTRLFYELYHS